MKFDLERLINGDDREWQVFTHRVRPVIAAAARGILTNRIGRAQPLDIEEIVQEVFMILVKNDFRTLKSYRPDLASITTWLTVIAMRSAIKYANRLMKTPHTVELSKINEFAPKPVTPSHDTDIPEKLLSPRQRLVMKMYFDRDMSVEEISKVLNIKPQSVRSTRHKAIKKLRKYFMAKKRITLVLISLGLKTIL